MKHQELKVKIYILPVIVLSILLLGILGFNTQLTQQQNLQSRAQVANCNVAASELVMTSSEQQLLSLINAYRQQNGAPALAASPELKRAAEWMSNHMGTGGPFSHTDGLGRAYSKRLADCGFTGKTTSENIAYNTSDDSAAKTFDQWKNSAGHNKNMLNPSYTQVGIAEYIAGDKRYWTFDAAAGKPSSTVPAAPAPTKAPPTPTSPPPTPIQSGPTTAQTGPTQPQVPGEPSLATPTFACLGACPIPTSTQPPIQQPTQSTTDPITGGGGGVVGQPTETRTDQGLLAIIISIIALLIQILLGRGA